MANLRRDLLILLNMEADDLLRRYAAGERDFMEADLSWEDLSGANLSQIILGNANLNETNLSKTNLSNANLMGADLRKANLKEAYLSGALLSQANLEEADLRGANISGADLEGAIPGDLPPANLSWAIMPDGSVHDYDENYYRWVEQDYYDEEDYDNEGNDLEGEPTEIQQLSSSDTVKAKVQLQAKSDTNIMNQSKALRTARQRLDTILLAIDTAKQLGCMDEGIKQALKYQVRKILLEDIIQPYLPGEWSVSDRAMYLGYNPTRAQLVAIGKEAARLYREQHGDDPPQSEEVVDGQTRQVKVYSGKAVDLLDTVIRQVMAS
ncbi:MAG TPA: pentapeptide repeat-containing protein [Coleofasciculaceae cyanobacterium]